MNFSSLKQNAKTFLQAPYIGVSMGAIGIYLAISMFGGMIPVIGSFAALIAAVYLINCQRMFFEMEIYKSAPPIKRTFDFDGLWRLVLGRLWALLKMWPAFVTLFVGGFCMMLSILPLMSTIANDGEATAATILAGVFMLLGYAIMMAAIPIGIILSFNYVLTEYILMDNPDLSSKEGANLSKEMMKGHKWDFFLLSLSFIGWDLLTGITCGILSIWTLPYKTHTFINFYFDLKHKKALGQM